MTNFEYDGRDVSRAAVQSSQAQMASSVSPKVDPAVPERLLAGGFTLGDGKAQATIHPYKQVLAGMLTKLEGAHVADIYAKYKTMPAAAIFSDPQLLRYGEKPMCRLFAFIGFAGYLGVSLAKSVRRTVDPVVFSEPGD